MTSHFSGEHMQVRKARTAALNHRALTKGMIARILYLGKYSSRKSKVKILSERGKERSFPHQCHSIKTV